MSLVNIELNKAVRSFSDTFVLLVERNSEDISIAKLRQFPFF